MATKLFYFVIKLDLQKVNFFDICRRMSEEEKRGFWKRWRYKYRFVILNSDNFEERLSFKLSRLNVFVLSSFFLVFLIGGTILLISLTPLREYIPGYTSTNMRRDVVKLNHMSDSLLTLIESKDRYLKNIQLIIDGKTPEEINDTNTIRTRGLENIIFETVYEDSVLRTQIEDEERFNLFASASNKEQNIESVLFFTPISGVVTQSFDPKNL